MSKAKNYIRDWGKSIDVLEKIGASEINLSHGELHGMMLIYFMLGKDFSWLDIFNFLMLKHYNKLSETEIHNAKVGVTRFIGKLIKVQLCTKTKDRDDKRVSHYHLTNKAIKFINDFEIEFNQA